MSCKEWNVILNEDIEDCMPMLFILCTSITGVISESNCTKRMERNGISESTIGQIHKQSQNCR